ncbi:MAG TPA: hypothetical protein VEA38_09895, partial [Terriglobales bacterium]|nr:hypothetical protein [Terriglobales bacterium]
VDYFPDGTVRTRTSYRDDKIHGDVLEYHPNGRLKEKTPFKDGQQAGDTLVYNQAGKLIERRKAGAAPARSWFVKLMMKLKGA